ncbi:endonuclease/exonuclease/phosphatase family protein [Nocardioides sp. GXQ0305]|uniref:endonuclease/exonuclease/phosphatase family protein n=1 Tax=Nocardioides sp. GXQ0305 TaxID=3423912 RepID=UPI003D7EF539
MVRIGTWNLENLFLPGQEQGAPDDQAAYDAKLDTLAEVIDGLHPEVLAVQEVGAPEALDDLAGRLGQEWRTALADPDRRDIRVGFLSRAELTHVEQVRDFPAGIGPVQVDDDLTTIHQLGRPGLRARVRAGGHTLDLVSVHLKSKLLTFPDNRFSPRDEGERVRYAVYALHRRAAEAGGVRTYATALLDDHADVVVAGDLNDEPEAATTQILLGPPGSEVGTIGFDRPDQGDAQRLWNTAGFIDPEHRWSRIYRGRRELIDHVLCSERVVKAVEQAFTADVEVASIDEFPTQRRNEPVSDHRPVVVDLADA